MSESANWRKQKIQLRRGTATEWTLRDTLLLPGEVGYETDTGLQKVGDGVTRWTQLPYWAGGGVLQSDSRLTDAREWSAETVTQAEAEAGSSANRRAFTAQRVFQAIAAWWAGTADKAKLDGIASGATANASDAHLLARQNHTGTQAISTVSGLQNALDGKQSAGSYASAVHSHAIADVTGLQTALDGKQAAGAYATLVNGTVPSNQLPSFVDDVLEYTNFGDLPATGEAGKMYVVTAQNKVYRWSGSQYIEIVGSPGTTDAISEGSTNLYYTDARASAAAPVQSVAGRTGTIVLAKADVGLSNVDNTSDADKPVSTATQTALDGKAASSHTHAANAITSGTLAASLLPLATTSTVGGIIVGTALLVASGVVSVGDIDCGELIAQARLLTENSSILTTESGDALRTEQD